MKIWHISDTHTYHKLLEIPKDIDMVIHSGDCSNPRDPYINEPELRNFIDWFSSLDIKHKIYVAGNHDTSIEKGLVTKKDFHEKGIIYLENETISIEGFNIFGSPHTPMFGNWAFMKARHKLERIWSKAIAENTDVVICHGPPRGVLDLSYDRYNVLESCGDKSLMNRINEVQPKLVLFGHIHNNKGIENTGTRTLYGLDTIFSNGSVVTDGKFGFLSSNGNIIDL
jgi:Icc-related predicted phosphoesterase